MNVRALVPLSLLTALAACSGREPRASLRQIPHQNVLLVTIDTLRADALGVYGGPAATPALDRLASEGVRFDFAHAHAVVTLPSHASILTGLYPFQHGIRDNSGYRLPPATTTLATLLKERGYATAAFIGAFPLSARFGLTAGFDLYDDRLRESQAPADFNMPERPATAVVALARAWVKSHSQPGPWFAWVHVFDPHAPYRPPPPFDRQYASKPYYGEVAATDAALAPLFDDVRASGQATLVVVTGDHGEALGEHGEETHGLFAYESTLRVPLVIAELPSPAVGSGGNAPRGEASAVSARHVDIVPTVLDALGGRVPAHLPGRSLLAAASRSGADDPAVYFEAMGGMLNRGWAPLSGVLAGREKYIALPIPERYDLAADPAEQTNLEGRAPDRDRTLAARLLDFHAAPPGARVAESAEAAARLRALGYVSGGAAPKERYDADDDPKRLVDLDRKIHRAVEAFTAGRIDEAVGNYRAVLDQRPDLGIAYQHLAFIEAQRGRVADAIALLRRAMAHGVRDPRIVTQLAGYLSDTGNPDEAVRLLEPIADSAEADADALNTLGIAYAQSRRPAAARRMFERVLAINPTSSVPLENLGMLAYERGDLAEARQQYQRALTINPASSRAYSGLGATALRAGDRPGAIEAWSRAVQLEPSNLDALYNLGTTLARAGETGRARPYLEEYLRVAPPRFEADRREVGRLLGR